jgi:hypothetical protein
MADNGNRFSRVQGLLTNQDENPAKHLSQKARMSASAGSGCWAAINLKTHFIAISSPNEQD